MDLVNVIKKNVAPIVLTSVFIVLAATSMVNKSLTCDEVAHHLPPGYVFLKTGDFAFSTDAPPLARLIAAAPMLFMDIDLPDTREFWARDDRAEFSREFLFKLNRNNVPRITFWGRSTMIFIGAFGGIFLFYWARKHFNDFTAAFVSFFYFLSPNILAHARLATTDICCSVFIMCTVLCFWDFLVEKKTISVIFSGIFWGLALASKFSAVLLLPVFVIAFIVNILYGKDVKKNGYISSSLGKLFFIFFITFFILWGVYGFEFRPLLQGVLRPDEKEVFFISLLSRIPFLGDSAERIGQKILYTMQMPLSSFVMGIMGVLKHGAEGSATFFMGEWKHFGHPLYYFVAGLIKTPIAILISFLIGITVLFRSKSRGLCAYLVFVIAVFVIMASRSNLQLGLRYVLPAYPIMFIFSGIGVTYLMARGKASKSLGILLVLWLTVVNMITWPNYLSYFNEFIGGPANGYKYLRDSNIDWGQDLPELKKFMVRNDIDDIKLSYFGEGCLCYKCE